MDRGPNPAEERKPSKADMEASPKGAWEFFIGDSDNFSEADLLAGQGSQQAVDFYGMGSGEAPSQVRGTLTSYSVKTGFGFITPDDGGPLIFAHRADSGGLLEQLELGAKVMFIKEWDDRKGKCKAAQVRGRTDSDVCCDGGGVRYDDGKDGEEESMQDVLKDHSSPPAGGSIDGMGKTVDSSNQGFELLGQLRGIAEQLRPKGLFDDGLNERLGQVLQQAEGGGAPKEKGEEAVRAAMNADKVVGA